MSENVKKKCGFDANKIIYGLNFSHLPEVLVMPKLTDELFWFFCMLLRR